MSIELGRPFGIPVRLRGWGFFLLVGGLFAACISCFKALFPSWSMVEYFGASGAVVVLFVASMLMHEAAHAFVALRHGLRVGSVELISLGARVTLPQPIPPAHWRVGALFAVAGPASDFVIATLLIAGAVLLRTSAPYFAGICFVTFWVNLSLAVGNLLPIFPLDGGRIVRCGLQAVRSRARQ